MMTQLFGTKDVIWRSFCFQAFISIYILCKSDEASFNILVYLLKYQTS